MLSDRHELDDENAYMCVCVRLGKYLRLWFVNEIRCVRCSNYIDMGFTRKFRHHFLHFVAFAPPPTPPPALIPSLSGCIWWILIFLVGQTCSRVFYLFIYDVDLRSLARSLAAQRLVYGSMFRFVNEARMIRFATRAPIHMVLCTRERVKIF